MGRTTEGSVTEKARELGRRYGLLRAAKFGVAGVIGFLVLEGILVLGLHLVYGTISLPSDFASSPTLVGLDVFASVVGVVVGFFVNERTTVRGMKLGGNTLVRLVKFEGVYAVGSAITIAVQLALLGGAGLSPALGNVVGAVVAYPVSYYMSMRLVWKE